MAQPEEFALTPLESRTTSLNAASEGGELASSPVAGTRVVEALDSYPDGGESLNRTLAAYLEADHALQALRPGYR